MERHVLFVCTANVCRSPVAERMLRRMLAGRPDVDGESWTVRSAGTASSGAPMDTNTVAAAHAAGLDLLDHVPRHLDREILATDGSDLVLAMTRAHLRTIVALEASAWKRTFTLKELARRASQAAPAATAEGGFPAWRERVAAGRRAADLIAADPADDIADPFGAPIGEQRRMIAEVQGALDGLLASNVWVGSGTRTN